MKVVKIVSGKIRAQDLPKPQPSAGQILVRVHAVGLNRVDVLTAAAAGKGDDAGHGMTLGREFSGTVAESGPGVSRFKIGDPVMCSGQDAIADFALADVHLSTPVPADKISMEEAAVLPVALNTMHDALVTRGRLQQGQSVLIQGASSGVGLMGLQIAANWGAVPVVGTSTTPARRNRLTDYGADLALDSGSPDWVDSVLDATEGRGVDLIVDQVGASVANDNMRATALEGRIVNVGRLGGKTGPFDFDLHALRRIHYIGVTFRTRSLDEIREVTRRREADLGEIIARGGLKLPIDTIFQSENLEAALTHMARNLHFGKIVIKP